MVPDDGLPADRANRIADGVEAIEANVIRLRELQSLTRSEYTAPDEQDLRDAVERKFEKVTEAVLDISREVLKQERGHVPERRMEKVTTPLKSGR